MGKVLNRRNILTGLGILVLLAAFVTYRVVWADPPPVRFEYFGDWNG